MAVPRGTRDRVVCLAAACVTTVRNIGAALMFVKVSYCGGKRVYKRLSFVLRLSKNTKKRSLISLRE